MNRRLNLLVVEDNEADAEMIRRYLGQVDDFEFETMVVQTHDGAVDAVENMKFDVVLMDHQLPDQTGLITISDLQEKGFNRPVIMLTGQGNERLAALSLREGADDYLTKGDLTPTGLQFSINHVLSEHEKEEQLKERLNDLKDKTEIDQLTGLHNRRALESRLREEMKRAHRYGSSLCLMMLDMDNFKAINDSYGHVIGDKVLESTAWTLSKTIRETDFLARYGGDEFCVLVTNTAMEDARNMALNIQETVEGLTFDSIDKDLSCTFSVGLAEYDSRLEDDVDNFLHEADKAMYLAKKLGRREIFTVQQSSRGVKNSEFNQPEESTNK